MDKRTYFITAINSNACWNTNWVVSAFSKTNEKEDAWKLDPYPYRLVKKRDGVFYVNPNGMDLSPIETDSDPLEALYQPREPLLLKKDEYKHLTQDEQTTYGKLLINGILNYSFKGRLGYINKDKISASDIEKMFSSKIKALPKNGEPRDPDAFYYDDIEKYFEAVFMFAEFALLFTPGDTEKSIRSIPGLKEKRAELFEKYKDQLHIPAVEAEISRQLEQLDKDYRKGDPSERLLTSNKDVSVIRKKLHMFTGKEGGIIHDPAAIPIERSLSEGWDLSRFKDYVNSIRSGSYSRGIDTALGGELAKWLLRAFSNASVIGEDCGSRFGIDWLITDENKKLFIGHYAVDKTGNITPINEDTVSSYLGKVISVRSPAYCLNKHTDYCKICVGDKQANDPTSIGSNITAIGNRFMYISMKAMHGRILSTVEYDPLEELH